MRTIAIAACLLALATTAMAADTGKDASKQPDAKAATNASKQPDAKAPAKASKAGDANAPKKEARKAPAAAKAVKAPPLEKLTCRTGPNDEQVRLIVEAVKGRAMEFAFYSRLGTRVCSIHGRRGDGQTKWDDADHNSGKAVIKLFTGTAVLDYVPGRVTLTFSDVDRMHYCGMYGELNGSVELIDKKPECGMQGLFEGSNIQEKKDPVREPLPGS